MVAVTIYSRPGCHLCEEMKGVVERTAERTGIDVRIEEIDVSRDAELEARYGTEIPVLIIDGKKAAKYRIPEFELARILRSRSG